MSLIDSFNKTNLDTTNSSPAGGPINVPQYNFIQKYNTWEPFFAPGIPNASQNSLLSQSLTVTALDVESSEAGVAQGGSGGPINTPNIEIDGITYGGFQTKYSSTDPYYVRGTQLQETKLSQSLTVTALDVESNEAGVAQGTTGGPNRTNSTNIPSGQYKALGSSPFPLTPTPGGAALKTREGKDKEFTLNAYTPQSTYMEAMVKFRDDAKNDLI
jgi:hypothetical protein|tara:strand:- start:4051 stop:4695 length:645 start_codon:yes stop_codon:yes gene_type:complete